MKLKCSRCGEIEDREDIERSGAYPKRRRLHCSKCGRTTIYADVALVNGVFLDETRSNLKKRTYRYVEEIAKELHLDQEVISYAIRLLERAPASPGRRGYAAGAIYLAAALKGKKRTMMEVGKAGNITDITVRLNYKELVRLNKLNPSLVQKFVLKKAVKSDLFLLRA